MELDRLLADWRKQSGTLRVPEGWAQGRATFGGFVAPCVRIVVASTETKKARQGADGYGITQDKSGRLVALFDTAQQSSSSVASESAPVFTQPEECASHCRSMHNR